MWKKDKVDPAICGTDQKGNVLLADYTDGKFYILDTKQRDRIEMEKIWPSVTLRQLRDAAVDSNNNLWAMSGSGNIKLTKLIKKREIGETLCDIRLFIPQMQNI